MGRRGGGEVGRGGEGGQEGVGWGGGGRRLGWDKARGGGDGEGQLEGGDGEGGNGKGEMGGGQRGGSILPMDIMECLGGYVL